MTQNRREVETQIQELTDKKIMFNEIIKNVTRENNNTKLCNEVKQSAKDTPPQPETAKKERKRP